MLRVQEAWGSHLFEEWKIIIKCKKKLYSFKMKAITCAKCYRCALHPLLRLIHFQPHLRRNLSTNKLNSIAFGLFNKLTSLTSLYVCVSSHFNHLCIILRHTIPIFMAANLSADLTLLHGSFIFCFASRSTPHCASEVHMRRMLSRSKRRKKKKSKRLK